MAEDFIEQGSIKYGVIDPGPRRRILLDGFLVEIENERPVTWMRDELGLLRIGAVQRGFPPAPHFTIFEIP